VRITRVLIGSLAASCLVVLPLSVGASASPKHGPKHHPKPNPGHGTLQCFDGTTDGGFGGVCKLKGHEDKTSATLDNTDTNSNGDYAGVFRGKSPLSGKKLGDVKQLGYHYVGTTSPTPGDLSLNVPLDENNNGTEDEYAFVDATYCPGHNGTVNVIKDANCGIYVGGTVFYPNWKALVTAHPTWKVAKDKVSFIIAERTPSEPPAFWTVSHIVLGKPGK
jgi:hypothetical protein